MSITPHAARRYHRRAYRLLTVSGVFLSIAAVAYLTSVVLILATIGGAR